MKENNIHAILSAYALRTRAAMGEHILVSLAAFLFPLLLALGTWGYSLRASLLVPGRGLTEGELNIQEETFARVRAALSQAETDSAEPFSELTRDIFNER